MALWLVLIVLSTLLCLAACIAAGRADEHE